MALVQMRHLLSVVVKKEGVSKDALESELIAEGEDRREDKKIWQLRKTGVLTLFWMEDIRP